MSGRTPPSLDNAYGDILQLVASDLDQAYVQALKGDIVSQAKQKAMQLVSTIASDIQSGSIPTAAAATNLVAKPTTTDLISFAAESGAFTDTVNGTTATLQANALGLVKYVTPHRPIFQRWDSSVANVLQPLSFTATLNVTQSSSSTATTTGAANSATPASIASVLLPANNASFSSFSASYAIYRPYSPQGQAFQKSWQAALTANQAALFSAGQQIAAADNKLIQPLLVSEPKSVTDAQAVWDQKGAQAESAQDFAAFASAYAEYYKVFKDYLVSNSTSATNLLALSQAIETYQGLATKVLNQARGTPLATVTYTYSTPTQIPPTHQFTAIGSYVFQGGKKVYVDGKYTGHKDGSLTFLSGAQITGNFTSSIYASLPTGAVYGRLRDFQISSEFDKPFGGTLAARRGTFSIAGYGQYQYDPTVLNITAGNLVPGTNISLPSDAQVLLGTAGWLGVVQGKVVINLNNGLTLPLAIKWSNKTDLLAGSSDTRGQIGISYDLSGLSSLISPK